MLMEKDEKVRRLREDSKEQVQIEKEIVNNARYCRG